MKQSIAWTANDGTTHSSANEAVAHELTIVFGMIMPDSDVSEVRTIAQRATENPLRNEIIKTLQQLST